MPNIHSSIAFSLVNIPVILNPIIKDNDTSFNQLHKECLHRIKYIKYCPHCQKNINSNQIIKGYEYEKDNYLVFAKEELDALKPINEKEIEIVSFIDEDEVDSCYFEKSYLLGTEKQTKAYFLFCEALKKTKLVALAKTVIGSKFYYCLLRFTPSGIIMTTLYFAEEVNIPDDKINRKVDSKELEMAIALINKLKGKFEPEKYHDEYQDRIKDAIDTKLMGQTIKKKQKTNKKQVSSLFDALEKSLKRQ